MFMEQFWYNMHYTLPIILKIKSGYINKRDKAGWYFTKCMINKEPQYFSDGRWRVYLVHGQQNPQSKDNKTLEK